MQKADALELMERLKRGRVQPFHLLWVTANRENYRRKKKLIQEQQQFKINSEEHKQLQKKIDAINIGGRPIIHDQCILSRKRGKHAGGKEEEVMGEPSGQKQTKRANHWNNRTRNIILQPSKNIVKIHNSLIMEFNHQSVTY